MKPSNHVVGKIGISVFAVLLIFNYQNCGRSFQALTDNQSSKNTGAFSSVPTYTQLEKAIFQPQCYSCHSSGTPRFNSYRSMMSAGIVVAGKPEVSPLYQALYNGSMPQGGAHLGNSDLQAVYDWIAAGAPESATEPQPSSPQPSPTPGTSAPAAPGGLAALGASQSTINLQWNLPAGTLTGVDVERSTASAGPFAVVASLSGTSRAFMDTNLMASTTYYYRVRASNNYGDSPYSITVSARTQAAMPAPGPSPDPMPQPMPMPSPATAPAAPTGLTATASSATQVDLKWTDASANETGFKVEKATSAAGPFTVVTTVAAGTSAYSDKNLSAVMTYYYRVSAVNAAGSSTPTAVANATTFGTFTWVNDNILKTKCILCHSGNMAPKNFSVETYASTMVKVSPGFASASQIYGRTADGTMPQGGPKLTTKELEALKTWINSGAANN